MPETMFIPQLSFDRSSWEHANSKTASRPWNKPIKWTMMVAYDIVLLSVTSSLVKVDYKEKWTVRVRVAMFVY